MSDSTTDAPVRWRPAARIRPIALGLVRQDSRLLLVEVCDDAGTRQGWRPLGGGIEFGEPAALAVVREFREELNADIAVEGPPHVFENLYQHEGAPGHEVVFVFPARILDPAVYRATEMTITEDTGITLRAAWVEVERFKDGGEVLFPSALLDHLPAS